MTAKEYRVAYNALRNAMRDVLVVLDCRDGDYADAEYRESLIRMLANVALEVTKYVD